MEMNISPMLACKEVLEQFDDIIKEYKSAIGPCGQGVCPYTTNAAREKCAKSCRPTYFEPEKINIKSCTDLACPYSLPETQSFLTDAFFTDATYSIQPDVTINTCGTVECPFTKQNWTRKGNQVKAACGQISCAFTKFKTGLIDNKACLELANLPKPTTGYCGSDKCKHSVRPSDLPPIHWDCPEPLPKGPCKNPDCPYLPADLRAFRELVQKGPCGSPSCTHINPPPKRGPPCAQSPPCFHPSPPEPCPFMQEEARLQKISPCDNPNYPHTYSDKEESSICSNPSCPFQNKSITESFMPSDLDVFKGTVMVCANPNCPHANTNKNKKSQKKKEVCPNPECPSNQEELLGHICDNPQCPIKALLSEGCAHPCCPVSNKQDSICSIPDCPYNKEYQDQNKKFCGSPNCPYLNSKIEKEKPNCGSPKCPFTKKVLDICCENPDCPMMSIQNTVCDNPDCPYAEKTSESTSFACDDPNCIYTQPLSSCGVPNCPYAECTDFDALLKLLSKQIEINDAGNRSKQENDDNKVNSGSKCGDENIPNCQDTSFYGEVLKENVCEDDRNISKTENSKTSFRNIKSNDSYGSSKNGTNINGKQEILDKAKPKRSNKHFKTGHGRRPKVINPYRVKIGHRCCLNLKYHIPRNMGWLWNIYDESGCEKKKPSRGWKPGAVDRRVGKIINLHRKQREESKMVQKESDLNIPNKHTLSVQKHDGIYMITMNPLKDPKDLKTKSENVYMDCTPLQFKVVKNINKEDKEIKEEGCGDYKTVVDEEPSTSSKDSLDIEFSPPAAKKDKRQFVKKKPVATCETQYNPKDIKPEKKEKGNKNKKEKKDKKKSKSKGKK